MLRARPRVTTQPVRGEGNARPGGAGAKHEAALRRQKLIIVKGGDVVPCFGLRRELFLFFF